MRSRGKSKERHLHDIVHVGSTYMYAYMYAHELVYKYTYTYILAHALCFHIAANVGGQIVTLLASAATRLHVHILVYYCANLFIYMYACILHIHVIIPCNPLSAKLVMSPGWLSVTLLAVMRSLATCTRLFEWRNR